MSRSSARRLLAVGAGVSALVVGPLASAPAQARPAPAQPPFPTAVAQANFYYNMINHQSGLALDAQNVNGQRVFQRLPGGGSTQQWVIRYVPKGDSSVITWTQRGSFGTASEKCLDVEGKSTASGAAIVISRCDGSTSQQWVPRYDLRIDDTAAPWQNVRSGKFLTVPAGPAFSVNLIQTSGASGSAKNFRLANGGSF